MELYRYMTDENGTGAYKHYKVVEMKTGNTVKGDLPFNDARLLVRHLAKGGGFAGWTPD